MRTFFTPRPCAFVHVEPRGYGLHRFPLVFSREHVYKLRRLGAIILTSWGFR